MLPSLYLAHGAPILALETGGYAKFLTELPNQFERPRGIAIFSSHWEYAAQSVSAVDKIETNHDFNGFPEDLYKIQYPARGDLNLSNKIKSLFEERKIYTALDYTRKMDSACWIVLRQMYPEADIPVVMLSINAHMAMRKQYEIGQALACLREENILIVGSGGTVHNPEILDFGTKESEPWAVEFDDWLIEHIANWDLDAMFDYAHKAPHAKKAAPRNEHMIPLLIAMGAADATRKPEVVHRGYRFGNLSQIGWRFD